jgi:replicative DNA helicase
MTNSNQLPPNSVESEQAVIGSLLIDPDALHMISDFLKPEDFYIGKNGLVYRVIQDMSAEGLRPDVVSLAARLAAETKRPELDESGDLVNLINTVPTAISIREYARTVEAASIRRKMIQVGGKIATLGYDEKEDLGAQLDQAETMIFEVRGERNKDGVRKPRQYTGDYLDWFTNAAHEPKATGLPTGLKDLDHLLGGLEAPWQYVLAARPGMGKSALAGNVALNLALSHGKRVLFFALEMSKRQIMNRLCANLARINSRKIKTPWLLSESEQMVIHQSIGSISDSRLFIDDTENISPAEIRAKTMRVYAEHGVDLVIVDHLHIMRPDRRLNRPDQEYGEMTKALAGLGKQINAPILTLAQLNRSVESRQNKRPQMSDLRESGAIEENAYAVMFLYRDAYYDEMCDQPNTAELIVAKHRDGDTGTVKLFWAPQTAKFSNLSTVPMEL